MSDKTPSSIKEFYLNKSIKKKKENKLKIKKLNVAVYRRVSTQEQATDGQSIDAQYEKIKKFVEFDTTFEGRECNLIDFCDNGFSGKNLDRPAVKKLLQEVSFQHIDFVIVVKLDRISRHLPDMYYVLELFNKYDIGFISINEKIDTKTAHGRFFIGILSSLSQLEREQTSERVQSVFKELVHKQPLGGKAPFGYFYYKPEKNFFPYDKFNASRYHLPPLQIKEINELVYPAVYIPLMFSWYKNNPNYRQIALKLTDLCIPTANTIHQALKEYFTLTEEEKEGIEALHIEECKTWNPRSVKDILTNPFYTGARVWNRKDNLNKKIRPFEEWIYVSNAYEQTISIEEFRTLGD